jgi:hypothetical protein
VTKTPCASCGDHTSPFRLQVGALVLCDRCTEAIPAWFFAATDAEIEAFFGITITRGRGISDTPQQVHADLALAYSEMKMVPDATLEWALAAMTSPNDEAIAHLLEPVIARGTMPALARAVGMYLRTRTVS